MKKILIGVVVLGLIGVGSAWWRGQQCTSDPAPQAAVQAYLQAMKDKRFSDAFDFVTARMTDGKARADWAALQEKMFEMGGVSIGELDVRPAQRQRVNAFECAASAKVPNVLHAADVLNNQGSTEFEVYTLVLVEGRWRVDEQESLYGEKAIRPWFPTDDIPALKDTLPTEP